ncbi:MFS transporter [Amycolatopsis jiangsuensis]|uniref:Putative MFS family arabinose efflux permease n=1 Tax=Amycolatopsis jiangsuensis TaxID=1181879 RepID=A0A840J5T6_9PSEU|nr:MFS transporter [Amycolatopsis jiangsuensis]MBB4688768.1 putative MFS family arabinose efflux permease [Amycolatopsis jiangsuensis]
MFRTIPPAARRIALASLFLTAGNGAFMTCSALYFTQVAGLSPATLGLGLTIAGAVGLPAGMPLGHLADRLGPRSTTAWLVALNGVGTAGYLFVRSFPALLVAACFFVVVQRGSRAALQSLIAGLVGEDGVVRTQAVVRSVNNIGIGVGAAAGGIALQIATPAAFSVVLAADVLSYFVSAALFAALPSVPPSPVPAKEEPKRAVLRDAPFAALTVITAVLSLHTVLLELVVPLWITRHTHAPTAVVTVLFVLNSVAVILFQIRIGTRVGTMERAVRAARMSGLVLLAACALFAFSAFGSPSWSVVLLVAAGAVLALGEMLVSAAVWTITFGLAPPGKQGQYQGFSMTGYAAAVMVAPTLLTFLMISWGAPGWFVLGAVFLLASLPTGAVVAWAARRERARTTVAS